MTRWAVDPATLVVELWARWLSEVAGEIDARTSATYELYGRTHVAPFFGTLGGINTAAIAQYQRTRLRSVKRETVQKEISTLRRFLAWSAEQGYVDTPPDVPRLRRGTLGTKFKIRRRGRPTELTPEEVRTTIDELPEWSESRRVKPFPVRARFVVAFETTLRPSTLDALSVPEHYERGADSVTIADEIDKARFGRVLKLSEDARAALDAISPKSGLIFGAHDYRDQLKKAAAKPRFRATPGVRDVALVG
jgi:hypothetical protein